jgi:hypothetical protein
MPGGRATLRARRRFRAMRRPPLHALLALLIAAAPAAAAPPWSSPVDIGPPADYVLSPGLRFSHRGVGLATWQVRAQPAGAGALPGAIGVIQDQPNDGVTSRALALGVPAAKVQQLPDSIAAGPVFQDDGRGLVLRTLALSSDGDGNRRQRVAWSAVGRNGTIGRAQAITTATLGGVPTLAEDHSGNAIAGWSELVRGRYRIRASWRPAGKAFGGPVTLYTTDAPGYARNGAVAVAIGREGRAFVAFADLRVNRRTDRKRLLAWTRTPRRGFGAAMVAGPHSDAADIALAVTDHGRAFVAWGTQDGGEEANTPWILRAATLAPRATRFSTPQLVDRGTNDHRPAGGLRLAVDPRGRVTLAWSSVRDNGGFPVFAARTAAAGARFGAPQQIAPMGALGGLAEREDGAAVVTYARVLAEQVSDQAYAAVRVGPTAPFGAPEALAGVDHAMAPAVAFNTLGGSPTAIWPARPTGVDPSYGVGRTAVLRIAMRDAPAF